MTLAEQLIAEGKMKNQIEGIAEHKYVVARRLLNEDMDVAFIARITELSLEKIKELKN